MKSVRISLVVAIISALVLLSITMGAAQSQQSKTQKGKPDKKPAEAGQDDQVVKLGTQLVTVPFNVTDKKNRYINDLSKDDIEVLEDNKSQQVFSFEKQSDLPITIAMLIDISGSEEYKLPDEIRAAQRFFSKVLKPNKDLGAVVTFENEAVVVQDLTSEVDRLQQALRQIRPSVIS